MKCSTPPQLRAQTPCTLWLCDRFDHNSWLRSGSYAPAQSVPWPRCAHSLLPHLRALVFLVCVFRRRRSSPMAFPQPCGYLSSSQASHLRRHLPRWAPVLVLIHVAAWCPAGFMCASPGLAWLHVLSLELHVSLFSLHLLTTSPHAAY